MVSVSAYRITYTALLAALSLSALMTLILSYRFAAQQQEVLVAKQTSVQRTVASAAQHIIQLVRTIEPFAQSVAQQLEGKKFSKTELETLLASKPAHITGVGVLFTPESSNYQSLVFIEQNNSQKLLDITKLIPKLAENTWYQQALDFGKSDIGLFIDPINEQHAFIYAQAVHDEKKNTIGVIFAIQSISHIKHLLTTVYADQTGYWFLTDTENTLLIHPRSMFFNHTHEIAQPSQAPENNPLWALARAERAQQPSAMVRGYDELLETNAVLSYTTVAGLPLVLFHVSSMLETFNRNNTIRHHLFFIIISMLILCICAALFAMVKKYEQLNRLWFSSSFIALCLLIALCAIWYVTSNYPNMPTDSIIIDSKRSLYQTIEQLKNKQLPVAEKTPIVSESDVVPLLNYRYKQGRYVPTGIFINNLNFIDQERIEFVGIIWQRYFDGIHDTISRGFIFPQLASKINSVEIGRIKQEKQETILWLVSCTLSQSFSYSTYPFDTKNITIQLAHKDFDKNITLVPDLDAYSLLVPQVHPGIGPYAHVPGWNFIESFFGYKIVNYLTNFGIYNYGSFGMTNQIDKTFAPELHFTILAQRYLFEILTTDLITILVIAFLLFMILLTYQIQGVASTLSLLAAILFSTILAQLHFKSKVLSHELVYFESFYFVLYSAILAVCLVILLHLYDFKIRLIEYKNNIVSKLLYWPCTLLVLFVITLVYLY